MINFGKISYKKFGFLAKIVRLPLRLIPKNMVVPILQGEIKGYKWIVGSGVHGYWLGSYEMEKVKEYASFIKKFRPKCIYDIGAHVGYYTLISSKLLDKYGLVYSFEPNERKI